MKIPTLLVILGLAVAALQAAPIVLTPVADSYVKNSTATTNYGTALNFIANNGNGVRVSYLRFSLAGVARPITSAKLDLTITIASSGQDFSIYALNASAPAWTEAGLSWNNAPGIEPSYVTATGTVDQFLKPADLANSGAPFATWTSTASGTETGFNVSSGPLLDFLNAATGDVTLLIAEPGAADISGVAWNSREAATGQPQLTLTSDAVPVAASPTLIRVVLIGGQSNADGRAASSGLPTTPINYQAVQTNVPFYYYTFGAAANADTTLGTLTTLRTGATQMPVGGFGPEIGLGYDLSRVLEEAPGTALVIIKYAKGGSSLYADWKAGGDLTTTGDGAHYQTFQKVVSAGLAKLRATYPGATVKLAAMVWVQGETDIDGGSATVAAYAANLSAFIADVRATFSPSLPFVFSRISANQTVYSAPTDPQYNDYLAMRAQQAQVAANVASAYMIDTDGAAFAMNSDNLHFGPLGQLALGQSFARALRQLLPLRVTALQLVPEGIRIDWNGLPLATYRVLGSPDLSLWSARYTGLGSTWTDTTFNSFSSNRYFYKVEEL